MLQKLLHTLIEKKKLPNVLFLDSYSLADTTISAYNLISHLHCLSPIKNRSCGSCRDCLLLEKWEHPYLLLLLPVNQEIYKKRKVRFFWKKFWKKQVFSLTEWEEILEKNNLTIGVEQVREVSEQLIKYETSSKPIVIWTWLPENLHHAAGNALLKSVEEADGNTFFFLSQHQK